MPLSQTQLVVDKESTVPLFYQVVDFYRREIVAGRMKTGDLLPPATKIATRLGVNYRTISQAYRTLEQASLVRLQGGRAVVDNGITPSQLETGSIAVVSLEPDLEHSSIAINQYMFSLFYSISDSASRRGYKVKALSLSGGRDIESLVSAQWGGVICLVSSDSHLAFIPFEKLKGIPTVIIGTEKEGCGIVHSDHRGGIQAVMEHLYGLGHRKIAFVGGAMSDFAVRQRFDAYLDFMSKHGLMIHPDWFGWYGRYMLDRPAEISDLCDKFLNASIRPTAIVCSQGNLPIYMLRLLEQRKIRVPQDISVTGYDDSEMAMTSHPPLTTIAQPLNQLGREAVKLLNTIIETGQLSKTILPVQLVVRQSTGPAKEKE